MLRVALPVNCNNDSVGQLFAVMKIESERYTLDFLKNKVARFKDAKAADSDLLETECFNYMIDWYDMSQLDINNDFYIMVEESGLIDDDIPVILGEDVTIPDEAAIRTECDILHVTDAFNGRAELHWTSIIKHTDIQIESVTITEEFLTSL